MMINGNSPAKNSHTSPISNQSLPKNQEKTLSSHIGLIKNINHSKVIGAALSFQSRPTKQSISSNKKEMKVSPNDLSMKETDQKTKDVSQLHLRSSASISSFRGVYSTEELSENEINHSIASLYATRAEQVSPSQQEKIDQPSEQTSYVFQEEQISPLQKERIEDFSEKTSYATQEESLSKYADKAEIDDSDSDDEVITGYDAQIIQASPLPAKIKEVIKDKKLFDLPSEEVINQHLDIQTHEFEPFLFYSYQPKSDASAHSNLATISPSLQQINEKLNPHLMHFLEKKANAYLLEAQKSNKRLNIIENGTSILFTPSGKIYISLKNIGSGQFKTTYQTMLIGSMHASHLKKLKHRAFSITNEEVHKVYKISGHTEALDHEIKMNQTLKKLSANHDLSNVNTAKSISQVNSKQIGIMSELFDGSIDNLLSSEKYISPTHLYFIASQMAKGVSQLHAVNIVHRDLKPDNFLYRLDEQGKIETVKVTDFGLSSSINNDDQYALNVFIKYHIGPEWHSSGPNYSTIPQFSKESDIYQLGVSLYQVFVGLSVNQFYNSFEQQKINLRKIDEEEWQTVKKLKLKPETWVGMNSISDTQVRDFLLKMLSAEPKDRPSAEDVANFFKNKMNA